MKSNLTVLGFAVLFTIIYCINSIDGRNFHSTNETKETKHKRQVEPLPDVKADSNDGQSQEKEEPSKRSDNIPILHSLNEETETKTNADKVEDNQRRIDSVSEQNSAPAFLTNVESKVNTPGLTQLEPQEERKAVEEIQPSARVFGATPITTSQIGKEEFTPEVPQATIKDEAVFKQPALRADDDFHGPDIKPAASGIVTTAVKPTVPHPIEHKNFRPSYWSRSLNQ